MLDDDNIIQFPLENKRFNMFSIPIDDEEIAENIKKMKLAYFAEISDHIMDDIIRSFSVLNLQEINPLDSKDIILIKESMVSALCRVMGLDHPLHNIGNDNIIVTNMEDEFCTYKFKDDTEETILISHDI